jgi:c-di-GMP-binding flagellar brake protein YcgR
MSERRSSKRVELKLPVAVKASRNESHSGQTRDLSLSGIFLYTKALISEGNQLEMVLMLPPELTNGERRWVCCRASVVRVEDCAEGGFGLAARIEDIADLPELSG